MQRKPSHFGSKLRPPNFSGSGIPFTDFASIGWTGGMTGRSTCHASAESVESRARHSPW